MQLILSEADSCRPQREERDSLEHWEDDGGASGRNNRIPFLLPSSMTGLTGCPFNWKNSLEEERLYREMQPASPPKCRKRSTRGEEAHMILVEAKSGTTGRSSSAIDVPLWRLYTLRVCYIILAGGLGLYIWPTVIQHTAEFATSQGIRTSLLAGLGATALLGFRYPTKMIPLLLFELVWKVIYLVAFALPLWRTHQITAAVAADITAVLWVVVFVPLIPWGCVWREYATAPGERWH
jgi:hypothetical protein